MPDNNNYYIVVDGERRLTADGGEDEAMKAFRAMGEGLKGGYKSMELFVSAPNSKDYHKRATRLSDGVGWF